MTTEERAPTPGRRLRDLVEPLAANVYFAPEAHEKYKALGLKYIPAYFRSRSACMGDVSAEVVVATFGVFNPTIVVSAMADARPKASVTDILAARVEGASAGLTRILGEAPDGLARATELLRRGADAATVEGHPICAGLKSLGFPGEPMADFWRAADIVREHRGDSHVAAWVGYGVGPIEITLLTEAWWGIPLKSYAPSRGWSDEQLDGAIDGLRARKLLDGEQLTDDGRALRKAIERVTDGQERRIVEAIGEDVDELFGLLEPMASAVVESGGYPADPRQFMRR